MKAIVITLFLLLTVAVSAQPVTGIPPVADWPVKYFTAWEDVAAYMVTTHALGDTMTVLPIKTDSAFGWAVTGQKYRQITDPVEPSTPGWHREIQADPCAAQAFAASLPEGTPVGIVSMEVGYQAGGALTVTPVAPTRLRVAPHTSYTFSAHVTVVVWFLP